MALPATRSLLPIDSRRQGQGLQARVRAATSSTSRQTSCCPKLHCSCHCRCCSPFRTIMYVLRLLVFRCDIHALSILAPLVLVAISFEVTASFIMQIVGNFEESVTGKKKEEFVTTLIRALVICICVAAQKAALIYLKGRAALRWREELVNRQHRHYLSPQHFYQIIYGRRDDRSGLRKSLDSKEDGVLENPDQRLSQDTDRLTMNLGELIASAVTIPGKIVYYSLALGRMFGWFAPLLCLAYFVIGAIPNWFLLQRIVPSLVKQEHLEGDFRRTHAEIRIQAESAAFSGGITADRVRSSRVFQSVVKNQHQVLRKQLPLNVLTQTFDYLGSVANYGILGLGVLWLSSSGTMSPSQIAGMLASGSYACIYLINSFTSIFDLASYAADVAAYGKRVQEVLQFGQESFSKLPRGAGAGPNDGRDRAGRGYGSTHSSDKETKTNSDRLGIKDLELYGSDGKTILLAADRITLRAPPSISHPQGRILVSNLSFVVTQGHHVVIKGESGIGKSTLLRAIAGLGGMRVPGLHLSPEISSPTPAHEIAFVPQQPFIFTGTLEELLRYPATVKAAKIWYGDSSPAEGLQHLKSPSLAPCPSWLRRKLMHLVRVLDMGNILDVAGWNDSTFDWSTMSHGEKQRIALIRLLISADTGVGVPRMAVLDEAFTALDSSMIETCLSLLEEKLAAKGTTLVFVSHQDLRLERFLSSSVILLKHNCEPQVGQPQ